MPAHTAIPFADPAFMNPAFPDSRGFHRQGRGLIDQGRPEEALPVFQHAALLARQGDGHGVVDADRLGRILYDVGYCLYDLGRIDEALAEFQDAVAAAEQGDAHGLVHGDNLAACLHLVGTCLARLGRDTEALA
ncbi:tetratricopeptide repeat protein, partial [Nitrospirillum viridazoti]